MKMMLLQNKKLTVVFIAILLLSGCGGGGGGGSASLPLTSMPSPTPPPLTSNPEYHLGTERFTTHQPDVLEQIGAHHAYAIGLTGRGVRIGIDDSIVDFTQSAEFGSRVKLRDADGAILSYSRPLGDDPRSDVGSCQRNRTCTIWRSDSDGDEEARNRWVRQIVSEDGWPTRDDSVFVVDEYYSEQNRIERLLRWSEVPTPYGQLNKGPHGTIVASVAAGKNLGVAPEATIIPIARNLTDDQREDGFAGATVRFAITQLPATARTQLDNLFASNQRNEYSKFDIVNRSYGIDLFDPDVIASGIEAELRWYRQYLPRTLLAELQVGTPDADKTILVYATGNEGQPWSGLGADLPYYILELRGHSLAVAATDPRTGAIAGYSNRCGPLPSNWNAARHGPHYCLTAPGTVRGLVPNANTPGRGDVRDGITGTSFAAPIVSGALALLMEHFRGTRGNTEVVKRMLDTAYRSGRYADLETYGAGHLDLEAALSPVGALSAGQSARALSRTTLQTPAAFGSVAQRAAHIELATFDEQDFPFWVPLSALVSTRTASRSPIPVFEGPYRTTAPTGLDIPGLPWHMTFRNTENPWLQDGQEWVVGFGPSSIGLEQRSRSRGWGYGFSLDESGYLGTQPSGAFGSDLRSGMLWTSRAFEHGLGDGWKLGATGTLAISLPDYEKNAIFQATPSVLSALSMRIGKQNTGLIVEQPLRAESGTGTFRIENGRIENGRRLYDEYRIPLQAEARELRMMLRHQRQALGGDLAIEVGGALNASHTPGERETSIGFAYRRSW